MKASAFLGGAFIKVDDVKSGPLKATIKNFEVSKFNNKGVEEQKLTLLLEINGDDKKLTLNATNTRELIASYGDDCNLWTGRVIALYFDPNVQYAGKPVGGVRVKTPSTVVRPNPADAAAALFGGSQAPAPAPAAVAAPAEPTVVEDEIPF